MISTNPEPSYLTFSEAAPLYKQATNSEPQRFINFNEAALYLKAAYDYTKVTEGRSFVKIKCEFPSPDGPLKINCFFDHDYEKKISREDLKKLKVYSEIFKRGICIATGDKKTEAYEIKLTSSTFDSEKIKKFTKALSDQGLLVGFSVIPPEENIVKINNFVF